MRLTRYIREDHSDDLIDKWLEDVGSRRITDQLRTIVKILKDQGYSKKYIRECKKANGFLYRGSYKEVKNVEKIVPRIDRRSTLMSDTAKETYDNLFYNMFGWKARSEGVFTIGDRSGARQFGKTYLFIPTNDHYKFIWSPDIKDMNITPMALNLNYYLGSDPDQRNTFNKEKEEGIKKLMDTYQDTDLPKAIKSGNEVMFKCDSYYLVLFEEYEELIEVLL